MRPASIDVGVIGGGPAGLHAARLLADAGIEVELFEEHPEIGQPVHCTGVLAPEAFSDFRLPRDCILNALTRVRFHAPSGATVGYATPSPEAVVIDRGLFDRRLAEEAVRAGVRIRHARVTGLSLGVDAVTITAGGETRRARVGLLACGANYAFQRRLGLGLPRLLLQTAQAEVPARRFDEVEVHFGGAVAPGGFAWAVPVQRPSGDFVRIGVMSRADAGRRFAMMHGQLTARGLVPGGPLVVPRQKVLPLAPIARTYDDRLLIVGDAAGLVKPTTGGGIYYSLLSAELAAEVLVDALAAEAVSRRDLARYESLWRKRLGAELRWQLVLRRIAQRLSDPEINQLFSLACNDGIMPLVRRTARFNQHREFIVALLRHPPARRVLFRAALA